MKSAMSLDNNSVREYQDVDYRSEFDRISDVATKTAIAISNNTAMQCNPKVTRGLQELIRGRQTNIEMTPAGAGGGRKVSMSISQARKELKGRSDGATRKDPPETLQSINNYTPLDSNFGSNAGNRWHRNNLSSAQLHPVLNTWNPKATTVSSPPMMKRVQKEKGDGYTFRCCNYPPNQKGCGKSPCAARPKRCYLHDSRRPLPGGKVLAGDFYFLH